MPGRARGEGERQRGYLKRSPPARGCRFLDSARKFPASISRHLTIEWRGLSLTSSHAERRGRARPFLPGISPVSLYVFVRGLGKLRGVFRRENGGESVSAGASEVLAAFHGTRVLNSSGKLSRAALGSNLSRTCNFLRWAFSHLTRESSVLGIDR